MSEKIKLVFAGADLELYTKGKNVVPLETVTSVTIFEKELIDASLSICKDGLIDKARKLGADMVVVTENKLIPAVTEHDTDYWQLSGNAVKLVPKGRGGSLYA